MKQELENVLKKVQENPVKFTQFSSDLKQIDPESRVSSIARILEQTNLPGHSTILDIGTGYGYGAVLLHALGYNVIGLEINTQKLEEGMQYWQRLGIDFEHLDDLSSINDSGKLYFASRDSRDLADLPDQSIDMVMSFFISGYMAGKNGAFREVGRVLTKNGNLSLTTEGPIQLPSCLRRTAVHCAGKFLQPPDLKLSGMLTLDDPLVYDKFILIYDKRS